MVVIGHYMATRRWQQRFCVKFGGVAQGLERCLHKAEAGGSIPPTATKNTLVFPECF